MPAIDFPNFPVDNQTFTAGSKTWRYSSANKQWIASNLIETLVTSDKLASASVTPAKLSQPLTLGTEKAASGAIIEFTGIPSWVKRITIILNDVSVNGSANLDLQIGSGSYAESGYDTLCAYLGGAGSSVVAFSGGFGIIVSGNGAQRCSGRYTLDLVGGNKYIGSGVFHLHQVAVAQYMLHGAGSSPTLAGPIDRVRINVIGGAIPFDAGSINIMYE